MQKPALQQSAVAAGLEEEEPSELHVEDDDSPDEDLILDVPSERAEATSHPAPRYSGVAPRIRSSDQLPREGSIIGNKYRALALVQNDAVTVMVKVQHLELGTTAHLRYLSPRAARKGDAIARFLRSARMAARVQSEHVARVTDIGRFGVGVPFVVTEAEEGWTLAEVLRVRGPLPVQEAVEYVIQAGSGVASAHAAGLIHGGLNLRNLVLSRRLDGSPLIRVTGLGVAVMVALEVTNGGGHSRQDDALLDNVGFLAPEQIRDEREPDPRVDVWALGVLLHTLIAGSSPFHGGSPASILAAVAADEVQPLSELTPDVAPELENAVLRALSKDPSQRFASVPEMMGALRYFASGDAVAVLDRMPHVSRATRPPPLPGARDAEPVPLTTQRELPRPAPLPTQKRQAIVPISRPPAAPAAPDRTPGYIAGAASVGAAVGAIVALAIAVLFRVGATPPVVIAQPQAQAPLTAPAVQAPAAAVQTAAPVAVLPAAVPAAVAPAVAPAAVAPAPVAPVVPQQAPVQPRRPVLAPRVDAPVAERKPTTVVATSTKTGKASNDDLFGDTK